MMHEQAKEGARLWARQKIDQAPGQVLILDTETCDLNGEVIELAIIDTAGNALYNRRFSPLSAIHPAAYAVHGLMLEMLADEPRFAEQYQAIVDILAGADEVLIYNAAFDTRCLGRTCDLHLVPRLVFRSGCVMNWYAQWYGEWRRGSYKWQPLRGGDHSALGDCRAALAVLRRMAAVESETVL